MLRDFLRQALAGARGGPVDPSADPEGAARALEDVFHRPPFRYELDLAPRGPNALEDFLTVRRAGHCQTYATAMALLLREAGVPTRFVTGFLGGEIGALGRYVLVRGNNVHAWVEAWCGPEKGWVTFDPTPFSGQPKLERVPLASRLRQVTDGVEFFYDRFVLSFGQADQAEMFRRIREAAGNALGVLRGAQTAAGRLGGWRLPLVLAGAAALARPPRPRLPASRRAGALRDARPPAGIGRVPKASEGAPPPRRAAHALLGARRHPRGGTNVRPRGRGARRSDRRRLREGVLRRIVCFG